MHWRIQFVGRCDREKANMCEHMSGKDRGSDKEKLKDVIACISFGWGMALKL